MELIEHKPVLLSTAYFPPIEYMAIISSAKKVIIELGETYQKQTWRNRCSVMTANGILNLTVPVYKPKGSKTRTHEIKVFNQEHWYKNHLRAIDSAYSASPFYLYYIDHFKEFFSDKHLELANLNNSILLKLKDILNLECDITFSNDFTIPGTIENDLRFSISPKSKTNTHNKDYYQVFSDRFSFEPNLSILDLLFNLGPQTKDYLLSVREE